MSDFPFASLGELGWRIRSGEVSPVQLAEQALDRLDTVGRSLNAVVTLTPDLAISEARKAEDELAHGVDRGPLHGIPYGAKDLLATNGVPTSWGMEPLRNQVFNMDAEVIIRLREAGAVLVGKLAMVEGAGGFGYQQPNAALTGPGKSAWNSDAWAGGSSSGSGSAVGSGSVPFAIGTETWGSILVPGAFNGVTGFRPTYGLVPGAGAMALSWSMDKIGPMARSAADCRLVFSAIVDPPSNVGQPTDYTRDPAQPFRFGVLAGAAEGVQEEVAANFERSLEVLRETGTVETIELPDFPFDAAASLVIMAEAAAAFEEFILSDVPEQLTAPEDRTGLLHALTLPAVDYLRALRIRHKGGQAMDALLTSYDAIVAPTLPYVATPITDRFETWSMKERDPSLGGVGNLCGLPSITMPNGFGERGLPTGIEMMGRAFGDWTVLDAAEEYQRRTGWHLNTPADPNF